MKNWNWFIRSVVLFVVVEAVMIGGVLLSPDFRDSLTGMTARVTDAWLGDDETTGMVDDLVAGVSAAYESYVVPLWTVPVIPKQETNPFSNCATCHTEYAQKTRFGNLYMDHTLHAANGLGCADCHTDIAHPGPFPPYETVCEECHADDIATGGACETCHAPASLPHYTKIGAPRGDVDCNTCHIPGSLQSATADHLIDHPPLDGRDQDLCLTCHREQKCATCHEDAHPADWIEIHPTSVGPRGPGTCATCHTLAWCSDACHSTVRRLLPLPLGDE